MKRYTLTRILIFSMSLLISGCNEEKKVKEKTFSFNELQEVILPENTLTVPIDLAKSIIEWRGTKLGGIRGHEGTVKFEQGDLYFKGNSVVGGYFIVNMESLQVTDIPEEQATAKNNLRKHLKSEFKTDEYPGATFNITSVKNIVSEELQVSGDLTICGITKTIQVPLIMVLTSEPEKVITTDIWLDRSDWNIGEDGSWLEKRVVDNEFRLKVRILF